MSKKKRLRPWYSSLQWCVETKSNVNMPNYKKGDWVAIYCVKTKSEAKKRATEWAHQMSQPTRIVPGEGHKTRRGF